MTTTVLEVTMNLNKRPRATWSRVPESSGCRHHRHPLAQHGRLSDLSQDPETARL